MVIEKLPLLHDAQLEYVLLRSCLSLPKMMYTLWTTDPTNHQLCWHKCDDFCREVLTCILGRPLDDIQWRQAQLPLGLGGLGLGAASDHAPAAYTTSLLSSQDLKLRILSSTEEESPANVHAALLTYLGAKMGEEASLDSLIGVSQKAVSLKINLTNLQLLSKYIYGLGEVR